MSGSCGIAISQGPGPPTPPASDCKPPAGSNSWPRWHADAAVPSSPAACAGRASARHAPQARRRSTTSQRAFRPTCTAKPRSWRCGGTPNSLRTTAQRPGAAHGGSSGSWRPCAGWRGWKAPRRCRQTGSTAGSRPGLAARLTAAGIGNFVALRHCIEQLGHRWHRAVPRLGCRRAPRGVEAWLHEHALLARRHAEFRPGITRVATAPDAASPLVPLERLHLPADLTGADGEQSRRSPPLSPLW